MNYTAIIPTTPCKRLFLETTLSCLYAQDVPPSRIILCLDRKPWDDAPFTIGDADVMELPGRHKLNRCHEAVNLVMRTTKGLVLIMDDDYVMDSPACVRSMIAVSGPGKVVTPSIFRENEVSRFLLDADLPRYRIPGIHPMRGWPKMMVAEDFLRHGGYDTVNYQHYWWRDTDLWQRMKSSVEFVAVNVPVVHIAHRRYNHSLFLKANSNFFMRRHSVEHMDLAHVEFLMRGVFP